MGAGRKKSKDERGMGNTHPLKHRVYFTKFIRKKVKT